MDGAVKKLLELKAAYKSAAGKDYKPSSGKAGKPAKSEGHAELFKKVEEQGNEVRKLKAAGASKVWEGLSCFLLRGTYHK